MKVIRSAALLTVFCCQSDLLANLFSNLFTIFLGSLYHAMDALPNLKPAEIEPYITVLLTIRNSGVLQPYDVDIGARVADIQERIRQVANYHYTRRMEELQAAPGVNLALPFLLFTDDLEKSAKLLDKRFPEPILGHVFSPVLSMGGD